MDNGFFLSVMMAIIFGFIYKIVELPKRSRERMMLISKITELKANEADLPNMLSQKSKWNFPLLKLGLTVAGVGLGIVLAQFIGIFLSLNNPDVPICSDPFFIGGMMLFGGLGLFLAYHIEKKQEKKD